MTAVPVVAGAAPATRLFVVAVPDPALVLDPRTRRGAASLVVHYPDGRPLRARARLVSEDPAAAGWFRLGDGAAAGAAAADAGVEWDTAAGDQRPLRVLCVAPAGAEPGTYKVRVDVWSTAAPEATLVSGPTISVVVPAAAPSAGAPWYARWPVWLTAGALALVLLGGGFLWQQGNARDDAALKDAIATATATAQETAVAAAATATVIARDGETAAATATARAQFARYDGAWTGSDAARKGITRLEIKSDGPVIAVTARTNLVDVIVIDHRTKTPAAQQRSWRQDPCRNSGGCDLGKPKQSTYGSDALLVVFETPASMKIVHRLAITVAPDRMRLNAVETIEVDGTPQRVNDYSFERAA